MKYPDDFINKIICGDCLEVMKGFPDNSIDTIITDPPYNLSTIKRFKAKDSGEKWNVKSGVFHRTSKGFMGKEWDNEIAFQIETWEAVYRIAKPGATLLCFGGTRTYHRLACAIEDAGWILKDCIMWLYGSGFPKATDISKQIDKNILRVDLFIPFAKHFKAQRLKKNLSHKDIAEHFLSRTGGLTGCVWNWENAENVPTLKQWKILKPLLDLSDEFLPLIERIEAEREVIGKQENAMSGWDTDGSTKFIDRNITLPATPEATLWDGWKSHGLKPAYEPIILAMKPNEGSYANNALKWGVAGLNIDGGRIPYEEGGTIASNPLLRKNRGAKIMCGNDNNGTSYKIKPYPMKMNITSQGRFPANIILDEEAGKMLDEQAPKTGAFAKVKSGHSGKSKGIYHDYTQRGDDGETFYNDGLKGASRFFYCAKASKAERNRGCEGMEEKDAFNLGHKDNPGREVPKKSLPRANFHPTVKPLALMKYLVKLTLMPNIDQIYLDPFCGSGTTLMACKELKRDYIGIDDTSEYCEIARRRIRAIPETLF